MIDGYEERHAEKHHGQIAWQIPRPAAFAWPMPDRCGIDHHMMAFVCEVDHTGLRRLVPEDLVPGDELLRLARRRASRPTTLVWALLHNRDAETIRSRVAAGGHADARGLLLNQAVELISLGAATPSQ